MRLILGCLIIAMALSAPHAAAQDSSSDQITGPDDESSMLEFEPRAPDNPVAAIRALRDVEDFEGAARLAEATLAANVELPPEDTAYLHFVRLDALRVSGQSERLHRDMNMLLVRSPLEAHLTVLMLTRDGSMLDEYGASYMAIIDGWPQYIDRIAAVPLAMLVRDRVAAGFAQDALAIADRLWKAGYSFGSDGGRIDTLYLDLAADYLRRRELADAKAILLDQVMRSRQVMRIWQERRFVGVWADSDLADMFVPQNMPRRAALEFISAMGNASRADGNLVPVVILGEALLAAGMADDAASLTSGYLPVLSPTADFTRSELEVAILHAKAHLQAGKTDIALATVRALAAFDFAEGRAVATMGAEAAQLLWLMAEDKEALELADRLAALEDATILPADRALAVATGICALENMDRGTEARQRLDILVNSGGRAYRAVRRAALCLNDTALLDHAIQLGLVDPEGASETLAALNRYTQIGGETPRAAVLAQRLSEYSVQPFVEARVEPVGRIGDWPLPRAWWARN